MKNRALITFYVVSFLNQAHLLHASESTSLAQPDMPVESTRKLKLKPSVAINAPVPLQLGIEAYKDDSFRPFFDIGYFRYPFFGGEKSLSSFSTEVGVRFHPFRARWFFCSVATGIRKIAFSGDTSAFKIEDEVVATSADLRLTTLFSSAKIGFSISLSQSSAIEFDLGAQFPLFYAGDLFLRDDNTGLNSDNSETLRVSAARSMSRIAGLIIPEVTLFRITWLL